MQDENSEAKPDRVAQINTLGYYLGAATVAVGIGLVFMPAGVIAAGLSLVADTTMRSMGRTK